MEIQIPESGNLLDSLLSVNDITDPSSPVIPDATEDKLIPVLDAMESGDIEYVILNDGNKFLQAAADARSGYLLEYNDGSDKEQFRATQKKISGAEVRAAFVAYLKRDSAWGSNFTWEKFRI